MPLVCYVGFQVEGRLAGVHEGSSLLHGCCPSLPASCCLIRLKAAEQTALGSLPLHCTRGRRSPVLSVSSWGRGSAPLHGAGPGVGQPSGVVRGGDDGSYSCCYC